MNGTLVVCVERRGDFLFISHFQVSEIQMFQKYQKQTNREEKKHVTVKGTYKPLVAGVLPNNRTFYNRQIFF